MLDQSVLDSVGASDENEATKWIYSQLDTSVKPISVFDGLKAHNGEYIDSHTDHHWTALGAYYAYREYCKLKNMTPHELTDFETMTFDGFLGTFYAKSEKSPELGANPDTVTAYIPEGGTIFRRNLYEGQRRLDKIHLAHRQRRRRTMLRASSTRPSPSATSLF